MSNYLDEVEKQLVELTERGAHRRPRGRRDALAVAAGVVVVVAVAAAIVTIGSRAHRNGAASHGAGAATHTQRAPSHPRTSTPTSSASSSPPPVAQPVPRGFAPSSFTAISETTWWLLGSFPCAISGAPCSSVVRTVDGGRSFVAVPAPRTANVSQLRFADPQDGFAYGPELWVTHDGGGHWHAIQLSTAAEVRELAIGGGYVYALVTNPSNGVGRLLRAPISNDAWSVLAAAGDAYGGLWSHGSDVLLEAARQSGQQLMVSHDSGASFASYGVPASVACQFEEPGPQAIWAHCATGMLSGVWLSGDGGQSFATASRGLPEQPNSAAFAAASPTTAVVGYRQLYRTTDGGASWTPVSGPVGITWWQYLGFTDPTHGVALGYAGPQQPSHERLYYTTDAGASYHLVRIG